MRKIILSLFCVCFIFTPFMTSASESNSVALEKSAKEENNTTMVEGEVDLLKQAKSGILIDAKTGKVLFEKNADEKISVASMTKMMTQLLILEEIEKGTLKWDEKLTVSANAAGMGGSQIWLEPNEIMSVRDLMKGLSMASANDAAVALAERISGTEAAFVGNMNQKAKDLGLTNTHFVNCTGLDEKDHYSTARDMAHISHELLKHEEILEFSSVYEDYLRQDTANKFWLVNTNKLVRTYPGADGLKTGHTDAALYCMAVTAKKSGLRLVALVFGEENSKVRNAETASLLDSGFNLYKMQLLKTKGEVVGEVIIERGDKDKVEIVALEDIGTITKKSENLEQLVTELQMNNFKLPLKPGEVVGKVVLKQNGSVLGEYEATVKEEVNKVGFLTVYGRILKQMFRGEMH